MKERQDTFIIDFVNSAEEIKAAFELYYEGVALFEETNPNVIYDIKNTLDTFQVYRNSEFEKFAKIFYSPQIAGDIGKLLAIIKPALDRYYALEEDAGE